MDLSSLLEFLRRATQDQSPLDTFRAQISADWLESAFKAGDLEKGHISYLSFNYQIATMIEVVSGGKVVMVALDYSPFVKYYRHHSLIREVVSQGEVEFQLEVVKNIPGWDKLARRHYRQVLAILEFMA